MPEDTQPTGSTGSAAAEPPAKKTPAKKTAVKKAPAKKTAAKKTPAKKTAAKSGDKSTDVDSAAKTPAKTTTAKKTAAKRTAAQSATAAAPAPETAAADPATGTMLLFQAPDPTRSSQRQAKKAAPAPEEESREQAKAEPETPGPARKASKGQGKAQGKAGSASTRAPKATTDGDDASRADKPSDKSGGDQGQQSDDDDVDGSGARRRRRRGGRRRRKPGEGDPEATGADESEGAAASDSSQDERTGDGSTRRRRRRRTGEDGDDGSDDPQKTVTRVRKTRSAEDQITAISGSTRLEAKKQRRRDGREAGRRRAPIVSEAEFLARREAVDRVMVIRQRDELTQIAVLEDKVLVEHYVARESQASLIGNVYLGRVQNVLPSMEAAFIDIGKGRNAVLYAGEVNWSALGHKDGKARKIESVLSSGQPILVQVTKDPIGHKGSRLTSQVSLAGRFLVYVPDGTTSGISRKLPDTERGRLKALLKEIVPDTAGVIVRTAAEGASEDELTRDVERLKARWEDIEAKVKGNAPQLLYGEPDLTLKVVRDLFTEDFTKLVIEGDDAWDTVQGYVAHVAPDLEERLERFKPDNKKDVFATYRVDEQIAKGLDRKVWLPSGGSLVIDRTEAMTVVDVNTGKFTGSGGNLEETVTKNNLEAAEEMVRQLRLRDIGGIIVIDFIDMVLESNRDLVLRRLVECLGRDRTRHQVAEVTSLGLVQMTRKRIGTGLVESFSENCDQCQGRGVVIKDAPVEPRKPEDDSRRGARRTRGGRGGSGGSDSDSSGRDDNGNGAGSGKARSGPPSPKDVAAVAKPENADKAPADEAPSEPVTPEEPQLTPVEPSATPEPEAAKVVTRSRRRSASRPAGSAQPQPQPQPEPQPIVVAEPVEVPAVETPVEPVQPLEPTPEPEAPKVVTRTRRRSASRPAGPPSGGAEPETAPPGTEPGIVDSPATSSIEHVPVKKKGSRKR